jgi:hypothetical protein
MILLCDRVGLVDYSDELRALNMLVLMGCPHTENGYAVLDLLALETNSQL